ncbi:unnamed protein product, partial [Discosporangium mesarthrocarpum]
RNEFSPSGRSESVFIIKPDAGCQGRGIFLTKKIESVTELPGKSVAQRYLTNPLLIDGYKFDLRLYVLVTSVDPMRVFLFNDGLVRICTEPFQVPTKDNINNMCMHLTNYSVNKGNSKFTSDEAGEGGFKRSIKWFRKWLTDEGHDSDLVWARLADACAKTLITAVPKLRREYRSLNVTLPMNSSSPSASVAAQAPSSTCFTIIGMDLMIDDKLEPWIIEINHLPSFRQVTEMDYRIKKALITDTLRLLNVQLGAREDWQKDMARRNRERLLGLPPKKQASKELGVGGSERGKSSSAGNDQSPSRGRTKRRRKKNRLERAREAIEQSIRGGFERIFPPSRTAPNWRFRGYTRSMRLAESIYVKLAGYSPPTSPRS